MGEYDTVGSEKRQSLSTILLQIRCFADAFITQFANRRAKRFYGTNKFCFLKLLTAVSMLEVAWSRVTS